MKNTTFKPSNISKPAPRWFRKAKRAALVLTGATITILMSMGYEENSTLLLFISIGVGAILEATEIMLANGQEYTKKG